MKLKKKGSSLQVVLVILLILSLNILTICQFTIMNARSMNMLKQSNEIRLIENIIIGYYKYENINGLLLSDYFVIDDYEINYSVDDMGSYYYIETRIIKDDFRNEFIIELNREQNIVQKIVSN